MVMKRIIALIALVVITIGLTVITLISLIEREVYGRWGTVIRMEQAPARYWMGVLLLIGMIGMLLFAIRKVWREG